MWDTGLSAGDKLELVKCLASTRIHHTRVQILDLEHNYVLNVTDGIMDGQVTIDFNGDVATRACDLLIFDPDYDLGFDTPQYADGVWFFDRMVQVTIEQYVPSLDRIIEIPIFTGPVSNFKRKKASVSMSCVGKDYFARASWPRFTIPKNTNYVDVIRLILQDLGETKFRIQGSTTGVLSADKIVDRTSDLTPWGYCRVSAASQNLRLFYAGDGYAVIRNRDDAHPVFTFADGDGGTVLTEPEPTTDFSRIVNVIRAESTDPANTKAFAEVQVDDSSPLSPTKLTRGGKPLWIGTVIQEDSITTAAIALSRAKAELKDRQAAAYSVTFDALPNYLLEEADPIAVDANGVVSNTIIQTFAFGLSPGASMPVGYTDMVSPTLARIRRF